jgi:phosphoribosyl 1,2-cyclic phosphodiesterase
VSGAEFVRYGGDTTCVEIESGEGDTVVLDAGTGICNFGDRFTAAKGKALHLVVTHAHLDHIMGIPYFKPLYNENTTVHIYGPQCASEPLESALRKLMRTPYFPVDFGSLSAKIRFHEVSVKPFQVGSTEFTPIRLSHPNGGCGFKIEEDGKTFVFLTDNELEYGSKEGDELAEYFEPFCKNADLLFHDGEYTDEEYPKYASWGHSKYSDAVKLAMKTNVKRLGLFHINARRTDDQMDEIVKDARAIIKKEGGSVECFGIGAGFEIEI